MGRTPIIPAMSSIFKQLGWGATIGIIGGVIGALAGASIDHQMDGVSRLDPMSRRRLLIHHDIQGKRRDVGGRYPAEV